MPLVLSELETEFAGRPLVSPYALDLAIAVVSDIFRRGDRAAPRPGLWAELRQRYPARIAEQLGMLAHLLASTSLAAATVEAVEATALEPAVGIAVFFEQIEPLSAEMIRGNVFRREELVRKWLGAFGGGIAGETGEQSAARINALDYRVTVAEYAKAEAARKAEAGERARLLREAEEREAAARGWRE